MKQFATLVADIKMTEDAAGKEVAGNDSNCNNQISQRRPAKNNEEFTPHAKTQDFEPKYRWPDLTVQLFIHIGCLYGLYLALFHARFYTFLFGE